MDRTANWCTGGWSWDIPEMKCGARLFYHLFIGPPYSSNAPTPETYPIGNNLGQQNLQLSLHNVKHAELKVTIFLIFKFVHKVMSFNQCVVEQDNGKNIWFVCPHVVMAHSNSVYHIWNNGFWSIVQMEEHFEPSFMWQWTPTFVPLIFLSESS